MALPSPVPVAIFFSQFLPGGTEHQMSELTRRLDRARFEVHVACLHRNGVWTDRICEGAASVGEFPIRSFRHPSTLRRMHEFSGWCRARRIAVVHATDLYANVFALPAAALARVPARIASRRELNPDKAAGLVALQRGAYAFAHRIVANSNAAAARLRREGVRARAITVIPNGLDIGAYATPSRSGPLRRMITVANLRAEKAHEVLIRAAARLLNDHPELEFWLVGGGTRRDELEQLASRCGVAARVQFFGHRDDVPALLAQSDAFVLTSRSEALPNGVMEAMAASLPVVATVVGSIPELIDSGRTGVLVEPDDVGALHRAIDGLVRDPEGARAMGRAARQAVESRFSFERMVDSFGSLYLQVLQHATSVPAAEHSVLSQR
jgi:glycosyltransferase involved in cell wall biosynthesis